MGTTKRTTFRKRLFGAAVVTIGTAAATMALAPKAEAACSGVGAQILDTFTGGTGAACALDDVHRAIGSPLNQLNPLNRGGVPGGGVPVPMGGVPFPPPAPIGFGMGNFCATPVGVFGPGAPGPIGSPCWLPNGITGVMR